MKRLDASEVAARERGWIWTVLDLSASLLLGLGLIGVVSPTFFYWLIHGDSDRYLWIISGPAPFDQFGGGPFQLWILGVFPILCGLTLGTFGWFIRRHIQRR